MILLFKCGYCGSEFKTLSERCKCEMECGKKQEEDNRRKKYEELIRIKKDRDDEILNAAKCLAKQMESFHSDYHERCSAEYRAKYDSITDYINAMNTIRQFYIS